MDINCTSPEAARHYLRDIEPKWRGFWFHMHLPAMSLREFVAGLDKIDDNVYIYHVKGHDNAMAAWMQEVVGDIVLAEALRSAPDRAAASAAANLRLREIEAVVRDSQPAGR